MIPFFSVKLSSKRQERVLLDVVDGLGGLSYRGQGQRWPVETVDILSHQSRVSLWRFSWNCESFEEPDRPMCPCWIQWQSWLQRKHRRSSGLGWGCREPLWLFWKHLESLSEIPSCWRTRTSCRSLPPCSAERSLGREPGQGNVIKNALRKKRMMWRQSAWP